MFVRIFVVALLCFSTCFPYSAAAQSKLFLVGGSWKTCGSFSTSSCKGNPKWQKPVKTENVYSVTPAQIEKIKSLSKWTEELKTKKAVVLNVLQNFHQIHQDKTYGREEFRKLLRKVSIKLDGESFTARKLIGDLPDPLYYSLYDIMEAANQTEAGEFVKEQASIKRTKYDSSKAIYSAFMAAAKAVTPEGQKPVILISTASGYDVFGAADYYLNIFTQLGADAKWLPLEATLGKMADASPDLKKSLNADTCKALHSSREEYVGVYNREKVYPYLAELQQSYCQNPETITKLAASANGIFFNGGDQSLTWQSFVKPDNSDRPWLAALRKKFDAGKLAISGTSAGTAVQSGVADQNGGAASEAAGMITGGTSDGAMIDGSENKFPWIERSDPESNTRPVTYHGAGGLKFFPYGVLDTHFSERGRQLRLAKLVLESDATFGFGVDETTALATTPIDEQNAEFEVIGQNGVYVVEQGATSMNDTNRIKFTSHYLVNGQKFSLKDGKLVFPDNEFKAFKSERETLAKETDITQKTEYRDLVESQIKRGASLATAVFANNGKTFSAAVRMDSKTGISTRTSMDDLHGYRNAQVFVLVN